MLSGLLRRLFTIAPSLALASTTTSRPAASATALPPSIAADVPSCASSCILESLNAGFPSACAVSGNLECLCTRFSSKGFSLGEVALGCVFAACPQKIASSTEVYKICVGQQNAVYGTHSILTVTWQQSSPARSSTPSPTTTLSSSRQSNPISTTATTTPQSSNSAATVDSTSETGLRPSAAEATSPGASQNPRIGPLTTGQIVGISVAGAATMIVVIGGIVAITCIQRRRERVLYKQDHSKEKRIEAGRESPSHFPRSGVSPPPADLKDPRRGPGGVGMAIPQSSREGSPSPQRRVPTGLPRIRTSLHSPKHKHQLSDERIGSKWTNPDVPFEVIGLAISPEPDRPSPDSFQSTRTMSRLLPEKPRHYLQPSDMPRAATRFPVKPKDPRPSSTASGITVFEEDSRSPTERPVGVPLPLRIGVRPKVIPVARLSPSNVRTAAPSQPQIPAPVHSQSHIHPALRQPHFTGTEPSVPPTLALTIPERSSRVPKADAKMISPVKVYAPPAYASPQDEPPAFFSRTLAVASKGPTPPSMATLAPPSSKPQKVQGYLPKYYTRSSRADGSEISPRLVDIRGPAASKSSKSSSSSRMSTSRSGRESAASYTTFESVDPEEPTPPEEGAEKQLSPVAESPISGLRYPKVPRPSNQAVPRSPKLGDLFPEPPSSRSLLAKRRGGDAAQDFERRLWAGNSTLSSSIYSRTSNLSGVSGVSRAYSHNRTGSDGNIQQVPSRPAEIELAAQRGPRSAEMAQALKSPLWAPRITPTRRGDDLFLSVSKIYNE